MKVLERIALVEKIGRDLQSRMTFSDIDTFLAAFGINTKGIVPSVNSKYVYVKEVLSSVPEETILQIADELGITHTYAAPVKNETEFWSPGYFRLFLSHLSSFKKQTSQLQVVLRKYGISSFVAHEDIEPSKEWQVEIEGALQTMDALVALLMPGFRESNWCDQEVGVAVGRGVPVVPVRKGLDPYGFIGKYQGIQGAGKTIGQVAEEIFFALVRNPRSNQKVILSLVSLISKSTVVKEALERLEILPRVKNLPTSALENLRKQVAENTVLSADKSFIEKLNKVLSLYGVPPMSVGSVHGASEFDTDIPF